MALALATESADQPLDDDGLGWGAMRLAGLLAATADRYGGRVAFRDQSERETWSGRPRIDWTYAFADEVVRRLARFFAGLGLPARAPVGICLPNGSEACLTLLAVEQAGLTPCLLPLGWGPAAVARAVEAAPIQAVVTQGVVGDERPAEDFCRLAARTFGLRFLCSFGPLVPDGVIDLDRVILDPDGAEDSRAARSDEEDAGETGLVTFARRHGAETPVFRTCPSVVGAAVAYLVAAKIEAGQRIVSLLAPDDHRGLTTGLVAALLSGASLECHGLFSGSALVRALEDPVPTHLVVPGWMETHLSSVALPSTVASVVLVHDAPARFKARSVLRGPVVDVLAFGELALLAGARDTRGQFALSLDEEIGRGSVTTRSLLRVRREADGALSFAGIASDARPYERGFPRPAQASEWRPSGFKADLFAGIVIGVS